MTIEPLPLFDIGDVLLHKTTGEEVSILKIKTYCSQKDEFLDIAHYSVKDINGAYIDHNVSEVDLDYPRACLEG